MAILKKYVVFTIAVWMAFNLVNMTLVFPVERQVPYDPLSSSQAQAKIEELKVHFENKDNLVDWFALAVFTVREGLSLVLSMVLSLFTIYRDIMIAFGIPEEIANLFQLGINTVLLFEIGIMLLKRG
jgi:hypothetical protein